MYDKLKFNSLCLDIETCFFNGPIAVVGCYQPQEGTMECRQFVKGQNLDKNNLAKTFNKCQMLITFYGKFYDVPKIKAHFPGVIPKNIPVIDLGFFAKKLNLNTNLKVLESIFSIDRMDPKSKRRGIAIKLWQKYAKFNDQKALIQLLEYNRQDTINLYPLAEELTKLVYDKLNVKKPVFPYPN